MYAMPGEMQPLRTLHRRRAWRTFITRLAFVTGMLAFAVAVNFLVGWGLWSVIGR